MSGEKNPSKVVEQKSIKFGARTSKTAEWSNLRDFSLKYITECLSISYTPL